MTNLAQAHDVMCRNMADGTGVEGSCQLESTDAEEQPDENGTDVDSQWSATSYKLMDIAEPPRTEKRKALAFEIDLSQDLSFQGDGGDSSHMDDMNETESTSGSIGPGGDAGSSLSSDRKKREDSLPMEMKSSMISSTDSAKFTIDSVVSKGSNPESASGSTKTVINNKDKGDADRLLYMIWSGRIDPSKKDKDKEREEKIRQAREKLAEERQRKIDEMKEQQRLAQEKRERQLELRRKKIEELKSREEERRQAVGDRRKKFEETDRAKKEAILQKAKERLTRYEQWKTMGRRKGGRSLQYAFGSATPREVCQPLERSRRSSSHSTLMRCSPEGSDSDSFYHRRAVSACSVVRRHCCIDINRLTGTGMLTSLLQHVKDPYYPTVCTGMTSHCSLEYILNVR
ncbi:hypothetical protein CHS0354_034281 [Potamilus streckersoni]|uniref:Uncharacterized protein n=1 Tax=Potamilus streckersoni TaxID=2493646 RepID=A0AAE0VNV8_9BIVA|nr:hypothetical protein CHS0354_034281 [Potamilus streckersoni]